MNRQLVVVLLCCLLIPCSFAYGEPATPPADCSRNTACAALTAQAEKHFDAGQLADSLRSYKLAYEVRPDPRLLYSIARLMHVLGQPIDALPYYRRFIDSNLDDPGPKAKAREYLEQCESIAQEAAAKKQEAERIEKERIEKERVERERIIQANRLASTPKPVPVYKKWWFWTIVGGAAAAVAVGTGIGVASREPDLTDVMQYRPFAQ